MKPILSYVQLAGRLSLTEFCEQHPDPVLVLGTFNTVDDTKFMTLGGTELSDGAIVVAPVVKGTGNAFSDMITIGRASNNDVQIREASVSKFHGYFRRNGEGRLLLTDANSTCGTRVRGTRLETNEPTPIASKEQIQFGMVAATFYEPADFYCVLIEALEGTAKRD